MSHKYWIMMWMTANAMTTHTIHLAFAFIIINITKTIPQNEKYYLGQEVSWKNRNRHINTSYSYSSWFVSPKHKTIKHEVLNDTEHGLTIIQYENTVLKAMMKHKAMGGAIKGADYKWKIVYEIHE
eukprot:760326_1